MTVSDCISILQLDYKENYQVYKKNDANCCIMIHKNYLVAYKGGTNGPFFTVGRRKNQRSYTQW